MPSQLLEVDVIGASAAHAQHIAEAARHAYEGAPAWLSVALVDEMKMQELNREFRGRNRPTNVLAFIDGATDPSVDRLCLGDLVLCAEVLEREAKEQRKPFEAHLSHLVVHGMLHLQGWDHQSESEAEAMEARERVILAEMGYPDPYLSISDLL